MRMPAAGLILQMDLVGLDPTTNLQHARAHDQERMGVSRRPAGQMPIYSLFLPALLFGRFYFLFQCAILVSISIMTVGARGRMKGIHRHLTQAQWTPG